MLPSPSFTNLQSYAVNEFNNLRVRALGYSWVAKFLRRNNNPKLFTDINSGKLQNKRFTGIQNIPVDKISGTFGREADFDKNFRPLNKHLRDRWIRAWLQLRTDGWQPILVHQVGEYYYVEDGHHRVSVARAMGLLFLEAEVWDHSCLQMHECHCPSAKRLTRTYTEACNVTS